MASLTVLPARVPASRGVLVCMPVEWFSTLSEVGGGVGVAASLSGHDTQNEGKGRLGFVRHCFLAFLGVWSFSSTGAIIAHALAQLSP